MSLVVTAPRAALGEILEQRRVYMVGIVVFTLTSLACGLAPSLPVLVAARILQGLSAAGVMSVNTMVVGLSYAAGPTAASTILLLGAWHWLFLINVLIGLLAVAVDPCGLPLTTRAPHGFDGLASFTRLRFGVIEPAEAPPHAEKTLLLQLMSLYIAGRPTHT